MKSRLALIIALSAAMLLLLAGCVAPLVQPVPTATAAPGAAETPPPAAGEVSTATPVAQEAPAPAQPGLVPLDAGACSQMAQDMAGALGVEVTQSDVPITDPANDMSGTGCQATATGTGEQFTSPDAVVSTLAGMLEADGWQEDPMLAAGGPTGMGAGFRQGNQVCLAGAIWQPDATVSCPSDQPISACEVPPAKQVYTVTLACAQSTASMANPASANCVAQGGTLSIEERRDGGQFGVCYFEDNRQCEEWALLRGECPLGGVKVTGYVTPAARYCAITGGTYAVTSNSGQDDEQGTCTLANGATCDAWAYYDGTCDASTAAVPAEPAPTATITATAVITYTPEPPIGEPRAGDCWTNSLAVWREDAWRCMVGNEIYDPCFSQDGSVICGASPVTPTVSFALTLAEPLPAPELPPDTAGHAWLVELPDGTVCQYATGATGGVGDERINYWCPSPDPGQSVVILGDLQSGPVWMAHRAVLTGGMPDLTVLQDAILPVRTVWR